MYQTFEGLEALYGSARLAKVTPGASLPDVTPRLYWEERLKASSAKIDMSLRRAGYRTPVDLTDISDVDERAGVAALLAYWETTLALEGSQISQVAQGENVETAADTVRRELRDLLKGHGRLPLAIVTKTFTSVYGPDADGRREVAPSLPDTLFNRLRSNWHRGV